MHYSLWLLSPTLIFLISHLNGPEFSLSCVSHILWPLNPRSPMSPYPMTCVPCHQVPWSYVSPCPVFSKSCIHISTAMCLLTLLHPIFPVLHVSYSVFIICLASSVNPGHNSSCAPVSPFPCVCSCCQSSASYSVNATISVSSSKFQVPMSSVFHVYVISESSSYVTFNVNVAKSPCLVSTPVIYLMSFCPPS